MIMTVVVFVFVLRDCYSVHNTIYEEYLTEEIRNSNYYSTERCYLTVLKIE